MYGKILIYYGVLLFKVEKMILNFILIDEDLCFLCKKVLYDLLGLRNNNLFWIKYIIEYKNIFLMLEWIFCFLEFEFWKNII